MMELDLKVTGGKVVTPGGIARVGIGVKDGRIAVIGRDELLPPAAETVDATGKYVMPGVVDPESHPGHAHPWVEDADTETKAAAVGGVTTWGIHDPAPRFGPREVWKPVCEPEDCVSFHQVFPAGRDAFAAHSSVDFFFTLQLETDEQCSEIPEYARDYGVTSFKFYCHCKRPDLDQTWAAPRTGLVRGFDDGTFLLALEKTAEIGPPGIVCFHPENWEIGRLLEQRLKAAGRTDMAAWDERSPDFTEAHHIRGYTYLAQVAGCPIYVQHCTNPRSIQEVVRAREMGVKVFVQTGPVWLYFTRDDWRINVPLRSRECVEATWVALRDGIIDAVGSDHVTGRMGSKAEMEAADVWSYKKSGVPSRVEAALPIMLHAGVNQGRISFERLVQVMCENPARIFGIYPKKGAIMVGSDADLVLVDLGKEVEVNDQMVHSRPGWTVLSGHVVKGWPVMTILRGRVIMRWRNGAARAEIVSSGGGQHLARIAGSPTLPVEAEEWARAQAR